MDIMVGVKAVMLSNGMLAFVDAEDFERVNRLSWSLHSAGYATAHDPDLYVKGKPPHKAQVLMHRYVTNAPKGSYTDHRDHNKLDNRKENLIVSTQAENMMNRRRTIRPEFSSKYRGVAAHRPGKWIGQFRKNYLGIFDDEIEAAKAYDRAARAELGDAAQCNFPEAS